MLTKYRTVLVSSYMYNGKSYDDETASLYQYSLLVQSVYLLEQFSIKFDITDDETNPHNDVNYNNMAPHGVRTSAAIVLT